MRDDPQCYRGFHLGQEPIDVDRLGLAEAEDPEDALDVVGRVPGSIKDDDTVCCHQVDSQSTGLGGDEEEPHSGII